MEKEVHNIKIKQGLKQPEFYYQIEIFGHVILKKCNFIFYFLNHWDR